jgi:hypothetical protein
MKSSRVLVAVLAVLCLAAGATQAAVIASDNFESYAVGALTRSANGGTGWGGTYNYSSGTIYDPYCNIVTKSLSYSSGSISVDGGSQAFAFSDFASHESYIARALATPVTQDVVYVSYLLQTTNISSTLQSGLAMSDTNLVSGNIRATAGKNGDKFWTRVTNGSSTIDNDMTSSVILPGSTHFLVAKISKVAGTDYNQIELFVDPTSTTEGSANCAYYVMSSGDSLTTNFAAYQFRIASAYAGNVNYIDNLTVADDFAGAVGAPEPATMGLLVIGGIATLLRRRRKA